MSDATFAENITPADSTVARTSETVLSYNLLYNGTNFDLKRSMPAADAQSATGIAATGLVGFDGTNYDRVRTTQGVAAGANTDLGILAAGQGPGFSRIPADDSLSSVTGGAALDTGGVATAVFQITGTWVGTITFEASYDGATYFAVAAQNVVTGAWATTTTANGNFLVPANGYYRVRADMTARTSGTATVHKIGHTDDSFLGVAGDVPASITDSGNPVKIGGRVSTTAPSFTDGQRGNAWFGTAGNLHVTLTDGLGNKPLVSQPADGENIQTQTRLFGSSTLIGYRTTTAGDILRTTEALSAAPNDTSGLLRGVIATGTGPGFDRKVNPTNLATAANSAVTVNVDGADVIVFWVGTTTTGTIIFEQTAADSGDASWTTAGSVLKLSAETWVAAAVTPTAGDAYMVRTTGLRSIRVRTATTLGATVALKWTGSTGVGVIKAMDLAPQPHNIGQTILNYQSASLGVVGGTIAITATTGKKVYITAIRVSVGGTTAGTLAIFSGTTTTFTEGTSQTAFFSEFAPSSTSKPGAILTFPVPWASVNTGEDIRITTTGLTASHISIQYYVA